MKINEENPSSSVCCRYWNWELQKWEQRQKEAPYDKISNKKNSPRLEKALIRAFWKKYFCVGLLLSIQYVILVVIVPIMLSWIITYFKIEEDVDPITKSEALAYVCYLIICIVMSVFIMHHTELLSQQMGMRLRIACCSLIYRKVRIKFNRFINLNDFDFNLNVVGL